MDTNVWIHLHFGRLLPELFELPYGFVSPDVIVGELQEPDGERLLGLGLSQESLGAESVVRVETLAGVHRKPGVNDLFALVLAQDLGAPLLTGDGDLRDAAVAEGVRVVGVLWLLDRLVEHRIVESSRAADALEVMLQHGARLPENECAQRLRSWRG